MPWITVDCHLPDHPKMAALPSDAARWGWLIVLTKAKLQRKPGQFASEKHFRTVVGRHSRFLKEYQAEKLLEPKEEGILVVHDWQRHQWAVRQERHREGDDSVTSALPEGDSRAGSVVALSVSVPFSSSGEGSGEGLPRLVEELTARPFGYSPGSRVMSSLIEDAKALGGPKVAAALREEHAAANGRPLDAASLVFGAHKRLYPLAATRRAKGTSSEHLKDLEAAVERA